MEPILVITHLPDRESALALAQKLVEARLAACVSVLSGCRSVYRWKAAVESADEVPVFIKTLRERYPQVEALIRQNHPYELPEIVAVPISQGLPEYLDWVARETAGAES